MDAHESRFSEASLDRAISGLDENTPGTYVALGSCRPADGTCWTGEGGFVVNLQRIHWSTISRGLLLSLVLTSVACGRPASTAQTAATPPCVSAASWSNRGAELRDSKRDMNADHSATDFPGGVPENSGDWAYRSLPVDISGPGIYKFDFGPLGPDFDWPNRPSGVAFDFNPPGFRGTIRPAGGAGIITLNGGRYFEVSFKVDNIASPCAGLTLWAY